jgi:hypothetical protein
MKSLLSLKNNILVALLILNGFATTAQTISIDKKATLVNSIQESSGLLNCNGHILTHNDSGGNPELYEIDSITGNIVKTVTVSNVKNIDWEDMAQDDNYIYIGDFGNNNGIRQNLKIVRILKNDYITTTSGSVLADSILFSYADQTSFTSTSTSNYDAEALIIRNDSVYIFTKNWGNFKTNIYSIPKIPGTYQAHKIDSLNVGGLVTGATYNHTKDTILLIGYFTSPFVWCISQFNSGRLSAAVNERFNLPLAFNVQTEGICKNNSNGFFVSSETYGGASASFFLLNISSDVSGISNVYPRKLYSLYPNPAKDFLIVEMEKSRNVEILDSTGKILCSTKKKTLTVSQFCSGHYLVMIKDEQGNILGVVSLILE